MSFSEWISSKESTCQIRICRRRGLNPSQEDPLEEKITTCFSILAQKIPWTEEPGKRVGHDWAIFIILSSFWGFPGGSDGKEFACNAGDPSSIFGSGRSPGEGNGYPLQYSCLENSMNGLQSMGLQRVRHDWVTNTLLVPYFICFTK